MFSKSKGGPYNLSFISVFLTQCNGTERQTNTARFYDLQKKKNLVHLHTNQRKNFSEMNRIIKKVADLLVKSNIRTNKYLEIKKLYTYC